MPKIIDRIGRKLSSSLRGRSKFSKSKRTIATYDLRQQLQEREPLPRSTHFKESWKQERRSLFLK